MQDETKWSAEDVLAGRFLRGKRVLVTGVSCGVGVKTDRVPAGHGAKVVGTARGFAKAAAALAAAGCENAVELVVVSLASLANVRGCGDAAFGVWPADRRVPPEAGGAAFKIVL